LEVDVAEVEDHAEAGHEDVLVGGEFGHEHGEFEDAGADVVGGLEETLATRKVRKEHVSYSLIMMFMTSRRLARYLAFWLKSRDLKQWEKISSPV
jgi:hypothetical protein